MDPASSRDFSSYWDKAKQPHPGPPKSTHRAFNLIGNMALEENAKCIGLSVRSLWADVSVEESSELEIIPNKHTKTKFDSFDDFYINYKKGSGKNGMRLLEETLAGFYQYCRQNRIVFAPRNFKLNFNTNIPSQLGPTGGTANITACLKCLIKFFNLTAGDIPKASMPKLISEIYQTAMVTKSPILIEPIVQVYEGLVYMDFSESEMRAKGHGLYEQIKNLDEIPPFWIGYVSDPTDLSAHHSEKQPYHGGQTSVDALESMGNLAIVVKRALTNQRVTDFNKIILAENFTLRKRAHGRNVFGEKTTRMMKIATELDLLSTFPISTVAIIGIDHPKDKLEELQKAYENEGFTIENAFLQM